MEAEPLSAALISPHWWHCVPPVQVLVQVLVSEGGHCYQPNCLLLSVSHYVFCTWCIKFYAFISQTGLQMRQYSVGSGVPPAGLLGVQHLYHPSPPIAVCAASDLSSAAHFTKCALTWLRFMKFSLHYLTIFSCVLLTPHDVQAFTSGYKHKTCLETKVLAKTHSY